MRKKKLQHSDGYYHARITIAFSPFAALIAGAAIFVPLEWWQRALIAFIGCFAGIVIGPDNDLEAISTSEAIWTKIPIIGYSLMIFWMWYWMPYAKLFRHRGSSHSVLLGTAGRILYLLIWTPITIIIFTSISYAILHTQGIYVGQLTFDLTLSQFFESIVNSIWYIVCFCMGLFVSDVGHILRDKRGLQI